jgi:hypothetical protein
MAAAPPNPNADGPGVPPLGHQDNPVQSASITVTRKQTGRGADVQVGWLDKMDVWGSQVALAHCFSLEKGGRAKRLHVQGMAKVRAAPCDLAHCNGNVHVATCGIHQIKESIKQIAGFIFGMGASICVKFFGQGQKWKKMLGYVQKDRGTTHFRMVRSNVTDDELDEGRAAWDDVRADPFDGKTMITKSNWMKQMRIFEIQNVPSLEAPPQYLMKWMIQSGSYYPGPQWITPSGGSLYAPRVERHYKVITRPASCTYSDVCYIFYYCPPSYKEPHYHRQPPPELVWSWHKPQEEFDGLSYEQTLEKEGELANPVVDEDAGNPEGGQGGGGGDPPNEDDDDDLDGDGPGGGNLGNPLGGQPEGGMGGGPADPPPMNALVMFGAADRADPGVNCGAHLSPARGTDLERTESDSPRAGRGTRKKKRRVPPTQEEIEGRTEDSLRALVFEQFYGNRDLETRLSQVSDR